MTTSPTLAALILVAVLVVGGIRKWLRSRRHRYPSYGRGPVNNPAGLFFDSPERRTERRRHDNRRWWRGHPGETRR